MQIPLANALTTFWNKSMETNDIPNPLKSSLISPNHKGSNKSETENYHSVALTSHLIVIKIYEKIIKKNLATYLDKNNNLNKNQHGFRKKSSCHTKLLAHYGNIINHLGMVYNLT